MIESVCIGCSIGCSLYVGDRIFHRKNAPHNEGKLCKFGMDLLKYYSREKAECKVDGKNVELNEAINEAKKRLEGYSGDEILFLTSCTATNEELAALKLLAEKFDAKCCFYGYGNALFSLKDIENFGRVILTFDPFVSYPLVARRVLKVKEVYEVGFVDGRVNSIILNPENPNFDDALALLDENTIALAEYSPLSTVYTPFLKEVVKSNAKAIVFNPTLNANFAAMLGFESFENKIDFDKVKAIYALEPELINGAIPSPELLIVQSAFSNGWCDKADVVIQSDSFHQKRGSVVNAEGRILINNGKSEQGVEILEKIGGFEQTASKVLETLNVNTIKEFSTVEITEEFREKEFKLKGEGKYYLTTKSNPFLWKGIDHKNFVELSVEDVKELGLSRTDRIKIGDKELCYKPSNIQKGYIVSEILISQLKGLTRVDISNLHY
ncbi:hypothetical protein DRP05_06450 [Archaeoglobales archaeon]|nr:MAG: hypothetical protein DRP05_06450 [Archaeoglobales archaeon]